MNREMVMYPDDGLKDAFTLDEDTEKPDPEEGDFREENQEADKK